MREFRCPVSCLAGVGEVWSGEYDAALQIDGRPPTVLDIGANVGAFSRLALQYWPGALVKAYEPNPEIFPFLEANCAPEIECFPTAVGHPRVNRFHHGNRSPLCGSLYNVGEQVADSFVVPVLDAAELPRSDIVKIDTEGAEADIIERLTFTPVYLCLEWHSDALRVRIERALAGRMTLVGSRQYAPNRGVLKFFKL